jgi:hypothetical protein
VSSVCCTWPPLPCLKSTMPRGQKTEQIDDRADEIG